MSKDQSIGGLILIICIVVGILYTLGLLYFGGNPLDWSLPFTLIAVPVFIALIAILQMDRMDNGHNPAS